MFSLNVGLAYNPPNVDNSVDISALVGEKLWTSDLTLGKTQKFLGISLSGVRGRPRGAMMTLRSPEAFGSTGSGARSEPTLRRRSQRGCRLFGGDTDPTVPTIGEDGGPSLRAQAEIQPDDGAERKTAGRRFRRIV